MKSFLSFLVLSLLATSNTAWGYTNTDLIYAQALAKNGIIVDHSADPEKYRFDDTISRAELTGIALKIRGVTLPESYSCKTYYTDVTENNWVCRAVEMSADAGLVSRERKEFNPQKEISKSEALAILMKSMGIVIDSDVSRDRYSSDVAQWQVNVLESALKHTIISSTQDFYPNRPAKRADIFSLAVSIAISVSRDTPSTYTPEMTISISENGDNRAWSSQYTGGDETGYIDEMTPGSDTIENWKELITRRVDFTSDSDVETFVDSWKSSLTEMDADITIGLEPVTNGTLVATYASEKLNERGVAKFFEGSDGTYMILYSAKFKNYNIQYLKTWSKNIKNAKLTKTAQ